MNMSVSSAPSQVHAEGKQDNMFRRPAKQLNVDDSILATLQTVPRLGDIKARQLLAKFKSRGSSLLLIF